MLGTPRLLGFSLRALVLVVAIGLLWTDGTVQYVVERHRRRTYSGILLLSAVNLVRVISLFWIGSAFPQYLDVAHVLIWQMIVVVIVLWLVWAERVGHARNA